MPRLPSELLDMAGAGYGRAVRLGFDRYCLMRVKRFRRMQEERVMVPAPRPGKKSRPKVPAPKYSEAELLAELDVDPEDEQTAAMVAASIAEADWDALEWDEGDDEGGADGDG